MLRIMLISPGILLFVIIMAIVGISPSNLLLLIVFTFAFPAVCNKIDAHFDKKRKEAMRAIEKLEIENAKLRKDIEECI